MNKLDLIISDAYLKHQIDLLRFTAGEQNKTLALLKQMQVELKAKLRNGLTDFSKARVNKMLKEATGVIDGYYKVMASGKAVGGELINIELKEAIYGELDAIARITKAIGEDKYLIEGMGKQIEGYKYRFDSFNDAVKWAEKNGFNIQIKKDIRGNAAADLIHRTTQKAITQIEIVSSKKWENAKDVYVRYGKVPKGGLSYDYASGHYEKGVSVFRGQLLPNGEIRVLLDTPQLEVSRLALQDRRIFVIEGKKVGIGFDGEPLLRDVKQLTPKQAARKMFTAREVKEYKKLTIKPMTETGATDMLALAKNEAKFTVNTFVGIGLDASLPSEAALKALVNGSLIEGAKSSAWWSRQSEDLQFKFANQVRQGIVQNETLQQIIRRVAGSKRLGIPGIMDVSRRNASALVHTSIMQVANDARLATFKANDDIVKGMRQLSTLDGHTTTVCIAYSGAEWNLEGIPIGGNTLPFNFGCPRHWSCRSLIAPITLSYCELGIDVDEPKGTRASDLGQIPSDTTFSSFLKRHDAAYVDDLLGPGRAKLWRDGKITLNDLVNQTGRPLTLEQLRRK